MSHRTVEHCPCDLWPIAFFVGSSRVHKQLVFQKRNKAFNSLTAIFFLKILPILLGALFSEAHESIHLRQRRATGSPQSSAPENADAGREKRATELFCTKILARPVKIKNSLLEII